MKHFLFAGCLCCGIAAVLTACTDTWDDHYEGTVDGVHGGSLWQAIQQNGDLSNFASVIEATGYDKSLGSSQVFTVFAPTNANFSKEQANAYIAEYRQQKQTMNDDDNTVIKEFVQNHIALYNHSVSSKSNDSIVLMNGKYALLTSGSIDNSSFNSSNQLYENGVLYIVNEPVDYASNIFEYIRKDADLDSLKSFLYNPMFYRKEFQPSKSVEGGLDSLGRTIYLDSVFVQRNELFSFLEKRKSSNPPLGLGELNSEDSTYWMVAPTNQAWATLVEEYTPYFNYDDKVGDLLTEGNADSLVYTNVRLAITRGTAFSRTINEAVLSGKKTSTTYQDSLFSANAVTNYNLRSYYWGANFNYYQYYDPLNTIFSGTENVECSNGRLLKASDWKINSLQTFNRWIIVEAENQGSIKEFGKVTNSKGELIDLATPVTRSIQNNDFRGKVWGSRYVEFQPNTVSAPDVTFNITNVLSNMGYDIYIVTTPQLANDSNATAAQQLPTIMRPTLYFHNQRGVEARQRLETVTTSGTNVDYLLVAEDFKFPCATYGLNESEPQVKMLIENQVRNNQLTAGTHTRTMCIDCILLVPHGTLQLIDNLGELQPAYEGTPGVMMYPHGENLMYYLMRR